MSKPFIILITIAAWALGCAYTACVYAAAHTAPYYADEYLYEFASQLLTFGLFRLPFWLVGLLVIVSTEVVLLRPTHRKLR